jgi:hypothetical protein
MSLPPPHPAPAVVLSSQTIRSASRESYLLGQLEETFRIELELRGRFRLQGPKWTAYFEQKRQKILDEIQRVKSREEDTSLSGIAHDTDPTHILSPTDVLYAGVGMRRGRIIAPPTQGHKESTSRLCSTISAIQPEASVPFVLPENKGELFFMSIQCDT